MDYGENDNSEEWFDNSPQRPRNAVQPTFSPEVSPSAQKTPDSPLRTPAADSDFESDTTLPPEDAPSSSLSQSHPRYALRKRKDREPLDRASRAEMAEMNYMGLDESPSKTVPLPEKRRRKNSSYVSKDERKYLRNSGKEYVGSTGKVVKQRVARPVHKCKRNKCHEIVTEDIQSSIFSEYWEQESHDKRVSYVAARIVGMPVQQPRPRLSVYDENSHPKSISWHYFFDIYGDRKRVCKETFLATLGETDAFLRQVAMNKSKSVSGTLQDDQRGKSEPKHKLALETAEEVKSHIISVPSYVSHYCRSQTDARYLPSHLNIKLLHDDYLSKGNTKVSYSTYERIFNTTGRKFKKPHTDTCRKCDEWNIQLSVMPMGKERIEVECLRNEHLERAEAGYNKLREERDMAENDEKRRLLVFDLQQCLETPYIRTSTAFYARQLYTFNLTVTDLPSRRTHCYMWHEGESGRGANEVASCLFNHITNYIPGNVQKLILASDSCSGQNRNSIVSAMIHTVLQVHPSLLYVEHFFLETGHTRLDCDTKHAQIEKAKKNVTKISVPEEWYALVRTLSNVSEDFPDGSFEVIEMRRHFYDFAKMLKGPLVLRTLDEMGKVFSWIHSHIFSYYCDKSCLIFARRSFEEDEETACLSMRPRRGKRAKLYTNLISHLELQRSSPHPISVEKKSDLMDLLCFLEPKYHPFYRSLQTHAALDTIDPDLPCREEDLIAFLQELAEDDA